MIASAPPNPRIRPKVGPCRSSVRAVPSGGAIDGTLYSAVTDGVGSLAIPRHLIQRSIMAWRPFAGFECAHARGAHRAAMACCSSCSTKSRRARIA